MTRSEKAWRRRQTGKANLVSVLIGGMAGSAHWHSATEYQRQTAASLQSKATPVILATYFEPPKEVKRMPCMKKRP